jgi:hypothetical protein
MTDAPFRAIGGSVVADHGPIALGKARALARFYADEAAAAGNGAPWRHLAARRAGALLEAAREAALWRRAAGWTDPEAADQA